MWLVDEEALFSNIAPNIKLIGMVGNLIEVIPLLGSDLSDYRDGLHDQIILNAIHIMGKNFFKIDELNKVINDTFGIEYPKERLIFHLNKLFEDAIDFSEGQVRLKSDVPFPKNQLDDLIENCFKEFKITISENNIYNIAFHQRYKDAFYELINESSKIILSSVNIMTLNLDTINMKSNAEILKAIIQSYNISNSEKYLEFYYKYLMSDSLNKNNLIFSIFQYAISIDILKRGSELYTISRDYSDKGILIIDTNIITALLIESNRFHETVESMISLSNKLGFKIFYMKDTRDEFERLIDAANYNVTKRRTISDSDRDNELVMAYLKDNATKNWSDKLTYYNSFQTILKIKYNINFIENPINNADNDNEFKEFLREIYRISMMTHRERLPLAVEHDVNLLQYMYNLKKKDSLKIFESPWILTLDDLFIFVSGYIMKKKATSYDFCIHGQKWFNVLIPFCDIEDIRENQSKFASAILKYSIIPVDNKLSLEEYSKLLANKFGLEGADASIIIKIISKSRRQFQLESSLEKGRLKDTKDITYDIFTNDKLVDEILEKKEDEKTIERLKESIKQSKLEVETLKVQRDIYRDLLLDFTDSSEIIKKIDDIQREIEKVDPDFFNKSEIKKLDNTERERSKISEHLEKLSDFVDKRSKDIKNLIFLKPQITALYEIVKEFVQ